MTKRYQKAPVVIEAIQFTGDNFVAIDEFITEPHETFPKEGKINIPTLEGVMQASIGDYIIKGINGEFYPCKPDIFEKSYIPENPFYDFSDALQFLKMGMSLRRTSWREGVFVTMQIPADIDCETIPKMQSLSGRAKEILLNNAGEIHYRNQLIIVDSYTGNVTYYIPTSEDMFEEDWETI